MSYALLDAFGIKNILAYNVTEVRLCSSLDHMLYMEGKAGKGRKSIQSNSFACVHRCILGIELSLYSLPVLDGQAFFFFEYFNIPSCYYLRK